MMSEQHVYDLIIIGAGPAGLTAGLYAGRATMDTLILEGGNVGGQVTTTSIVANYPAVANVDGTQLMNQWQDQVAQLGVKITHDQAVAFDFAGDVKTITGKSGQQYQARAVIVATGASPRKVGFTGEDEFRGHGVAYCSTCDGELFTGLQVFVVGGGYAAAEEADYLTRFAKHVTVLVRSSEFHCPPLVAAKALNNPKVSVEYNTEVKSVTGDEYLKSATLVNNKTGQETVYHVDAGDQTFGIFVYVGTQPATKAFQGVLDMDDRGYLKTTADGATNVAGVYAAGDVIVKDLRQIVTAAADGATAATAAEKYVTVQKQRLGIPIHREVKAAAQPVGQTSNVENDQPAQPHTGKWLTPDIVAQLKTVFGRLTKDVTLQLLENHSQHSQELDSFVSEVAQYSDKLTVERREMTGDDLLLPQLRLIVDGQDTGLHYAGIPSGHEMSSLVLGIYNVAGPGQEVPADLRERIAKLPKVDIEVGASLTCHFCPDVVAACQRIASLNPQVTATMIDLGEFPELRKQRKIMSVPATTMNNGPVIFGSQTLEQLVAAAEQAIQK